MKSKAKNKKKIQKKLKDLKKDTSKKKTVVKKKEVKVETKPVKKVDAKRPGVKTKHSTAAVFIILFENSKPLLFISFIQPFLSLILSLVITCAYEPTAPTLINISFLISIYTTTYFANNKQK